MAWVFISIAFGLLAIAIPLLGYIMFTERIWNFHKVWDLALQGHRLSRWYMLIVIFALLAGLGGSIAAIKETPEKSAPLGGQAKSQSGRLSFGSLLTKQLRQSATHHRQVAGRPAAASDQSGAPATSTNRQHAARTRLQHASSKVAVSTMVCRHRPKSLETLQNVGSQIQGSAGMQGRIFNIHWSSGVFSSALSPAPRLTRRSTGHQRAAHVAAG